MIWVLCLAMGVIGPIVLIAFQRARRRALKELRQAKAAAERLRRLDHSRARHKALRVLQDRLAEQKKRQP